MARDTGVGAKSEGIRGHDIGWGSEWVGGGGGGEGCLAAVVCKALISLLFRESQRNNSMFCEGTACCLVRAIWLSEGALGNS